MAGTTVNLLGVSQALRLRLLLYRSVNGSATLAERLTGGLHRGTPPDNADYPYGAFRVLNLRPYPIDGPVFSADIELKLFYRPRAEGDALQDATDVAVEALCGGVIPYVDLTAGISRVDVRDSDVLDAFSEHADHEVITSRTMFFVVLYPPAV